MRNKSPIHARRGRRDSPILVVGQSETLRNKILQLFDDGSKGMPTIMYVGLAKQLRDSFQQILDLQEEQCKPIKPKSF